VAVYFGQTAAISGTSLAKQCADPNVDIVILAFVVSRNDSGGSYPGVNFGAAAKLLSRKRKLLDCCLAPSRRPTSTPVKRHTARRFF
jgi:hypothetical protein